MSSLARAPQIKEITIDGNPVTLNTDYISFLVSYLPNLQLLSTMQINEQIRRTAMAWRLSKEQSNSAFLDLGAQVCMNLRREEAISNAKTKWELLRSGARTSTIGGSGGGGGGSSNKTANDNRGNVLHARQNSSTKSTVACCLDRAKTKAFGSLTSINENVEARKIHIKKRSNSSDNLFRLEDTSKLYPLEFKLPPILDSIVNNLTSGKVDDSLSSDDKENVCKAKAHDDTEDTSNSESDNSESHESLKTGLRDHLLFTSNGCGSSLDFLAKSTVCKKFITPKNFNTEDMTTRVRADIRDSPPPPLPLPLPSTKWSERKMLMDENKTVTDDRSMRKASRNQDGQSDCHPKSIVSSSGYCSLSSKTSSLDSCKSLLSDSSTSSIPRSAVDRKRCHDHEKDKGRIKSAQTKRLVHYKSNRAATARAKFRALAPQSPPLRPAKIPLKEREQGRRILSAEPSNVLITYMRLHVHITLHSI